MAGHNGVFGRISGWLNDYFLWLLIGAYLLAAICPWVGTSIRHVIVLDDRDSVKISLPMLLLALLLINAGLGSDVSDIRNVLRRPLTIVVGVLATFAVPLAVVVGLSKALIWWQDPDEAQCLIAGLAIVAAMPVAGSSTAWSQQSGGSASLSLSLVVVTTLLSPITTPLAMSALSPQELNIATTTGLNGAGTVTFLVVCVVVPSVFGMAVRQLVGSKLIARILPALKMVGTLVLLLLCYANATASLPSITTNPDWDFLALVLAAVAILCGSGFMAGWAVARIVGADGSQKRSLVFGLGMTNNGTGLVVAGTALSGFPAAIFPVLMYNLVQHLIAGVVSSRFESAKVQTRFGDR